MAVVFQFWGNQVGTVESVDDDGNGNSVFQIGEMPFLATDRILVTFTNESFDENGEFLEGGPIEYLEVRVIRDGQTYTLYTNPGDKVKESGSGENKEQGDSFFQTNDSIGPATSGPFSDIPEDQYLFVTGTTLTTNGTVTISRQSGENGNSNFDMEHGLNNLICFARGALIQTPHGLVPVEMLDVGDLVETMDHGPQPIRWINSRSLRHVPVDLLPVRIARDTFGPGRPFADLQVSPQHRILLESSMSELLFGETQVLSAAKALINDLTVRPHRPVGGVEYFHFCFDAHEIVFANGLACESFFPGQIAMGALQDEAQIELTALFPELALPDLPLPLVTARYVLRSFETQVLVASAPDMLSTGHAGHDQVLCAA